MLGVRAIVLRGYSATDGAVDLPLAMIPHELFKKYLRQDKICQGSYPHVDGYAARAPPKPFIAELYMNDASKSNGVRLIT
jgi:hypothetical protein